MKSKNAIAQEKFKSEMKANGFSRIEVYVINNPEAKAKLKKYIARLNKQFNCIKFTESQE